MIRDPQPNLARVPSPPCDGYFTRAKKAWLLAKVASLEFPRNDMEAIRGLEEEMLEARFGGT